MGKTILHIDLNSFFATCVQQDDIKLRGRPVGVVQDAGRRGVIIGSSWEAKMVGINTGCLVWQAKKIYPQIKIVPANFDLFIHYAKLLRKVCRFYSKRVEIFSIDELFLDVSAFKSGFKVAKEIKRRIKVEVGPLLTVSIGVAENKMLAKLASGSQKPDGLVIVESNKKLEFLDKFELTDICGIASKIESRLNKLGIYSIRQLRQAPKCFLVHEFGIMGNLYHKWASGEGDVNVLENWQVMAEKSFGNQVTLPEDIRGEEEIKQVILWLCWQVAGRMRAKNMGAKTVNLTLRGGGEGFHKQFSPGKPLSTGFDIYETVMGVYKRGKRKRQVKSVRFVGVSASNLVSMQNINMNLFSYKKEKLSFAWDKIAKKYGSFYLRPASLLYKKIKESNLNGFTKRF